MSKNIITIEGKQSLILGHGFDRWNGFHVGREQPNEGVISYDVLIFT